MKRIIVAYDQNRGIGAANDLLWQRDLPADLKHFRETTTGSTVIMGKNTYDSIGRPLPNRDNIVLSRSSETIDGVRVVSGLDEAYAAASTPDVYIVGGGQVYTRALATVDEVCATEVQDVFPAAEIFFPELDPIAWHEVSREHHEVDETNKYAFDFVIYERIKNEAPRA